MYNTNNPIPSSALEDMADNAKTFDALVTKTEGTTTDRLGRTRRVFQQILMDIGFQPLEGSFQTGATITARNQTLYDEVSKVFYAWGGALPKVVAANSTPSTAGGVGVGAWSDKTDLTLRAELTASGSSISDIAALKSNLEDPAGAIDHPTLQIARWRDQGDLRGWGCVCDGIADDSDNFQAAVIYAETNDKSIFIPGKIRITKKITFTKPPQIRGYKYSPPVLGSFGGVPYAHTGCIIYSEVASGYCLDINPPSNNKYIRGLDIVDVHVLARGAGASGSGVRISNCGWGGYTKGFVVEGFTGGGLTLSQVQDSLFNQLEILSCGTDGVYAALYITGGSNMLTFIRPRLEANIFQLKIDSGFGFDFIAPHFEQGDYPSASAGSEFQKINLNSSIVLTACSSAKFKGGMLTGATLQNQMSQYSITAAQAAYYITVGGDCSGILFDGCAMGFGYGSGKILTMNGDGSVTNCNFMNLCTEYQSIYLNANIMFRGNSLNYQDNATNTKLVLMAAIYAVIEGNLFTCVNSGSVTKTDGAFFLGDSSKRMNLGKNQYIVSNYALFSDGSPILIDQTKKEYVTVGIGALEMRKYDPNMAYSVATSGSITAINYMLQNQEAEFFNTSSGSVTFVNSASLACKGSVNAVVPAGGSIKFKYSPFSGVVTELSRSF